MRYGDFPPMEGMPFEPDPASIAHAQLDLGGGTITGGDAMPSEDLAVRDTAYSLLYSADAAEQARELIDKLVSAGGSVNMPFELGPWGSHYGQVFDRFGGSSTGMGSGSPGCAAFEHGRWSRSLD